MDAVTEYVDHVRIAKTLLEKQAEVNALRAERDALAARVAELEGERSHEVTAPDRAAVEAAIKRVTVFLRAVESYGDDEEGNVITSECNSRGGPDDPGYLPLNRDDLRTVLDELERLGQERAAWEDASRCFHCGCQLGVALCTACVDQVADKAREATDLAARDEREAGTTCAFPGCVHPDHQAVRDGEADR